MQCLNCGRTLTPAALVSGACPSCGFAIPAPMPAEPRAASAPTAEIAPMLAVTHEQPFSAVTPALDVTQEQPIIVTTPALVEPLAAVNVAPVTSPGEFAAPVEVAVAQTTWTAPATPAIVNPLIPPVPPMMPPVQAYPAGYMPSAPAYPPSYAPPAPYPPQAPYPNATGPMPGYPPTGYATGAYPPGAYPPGTYPTPTLAPVKKKGVSGLTVGLIAGVAVVIVALISSLIFLGRSGIGPLARVTPTTPPPTATATVIPSPTLLAVAPAPAGFTTFTANDGSYGLNYPSDWVQTAQPSSGITLELFTSPDSLDSFISAPVTSTIPTNQYQQFGESFANGFKATSALFDATPTSVTIGANTWNKETGTFTFQGLPYMCVVLGIDRSAGTFFTIYLAPKSAFNAVDSAKFTPMTQSVTFLKP